MTPVRCRARQTALRGIRSRLSPQRCIPVDLGAVQIRMTPSWVQGTAWQKRSRRKLRRSDCRAGSDSLPSRSSASSRPVGSAFPSGVNLIGMHNPDYSQFSVRVWKDGSVAGRDDPYVAFPIHPRVATPLQSRACWRRLFAGVATPRRTTVPAVRFHLGLEIIDE